MEKLSGSRIVLSNPMKCKYIYKNKNNLF